jgi:predicted nuclease of restriction endonuclease-like (RecB) superfamily
LSLEVPIETVSKILSDIKTTQIYAKVIYAEVIRNPYVLEFLDLDEKLEYNESDLEQQILNHLQEFLIELRTGFCFEARQKRM